MKLSFLLITGLIVSGLAFTSMTQSSSGIDVITVTDSSVPSTTVYYVATGLATPGSVRIEGTQTSPPVPNNDNGHNYECERSSETCYECDNCEIQEIN
jgi:hypothetical protein